MIVKGKYYVVSVAGSTNIDGITDWQIGDWLIFNGTVWQKIDQSNLVTSVAGRTGNVVLTTADIGGLGTIATQNANAVAITGGTATLTSLTVNDNTILGSSNTDTVTFTARINSDFEPATDNAFDLGRVGHEWRDLFIDGTANIDSLIADTADINAGTIDGTVIGGTTRAAGSFTTLNANGNVTLGDATADTIAANGRFNTDVVPSTDNARDLGTAALKWKQVYATTFTEGTFPVVVQTDIGTAPNEIPLNQYLGNLAYQDAANIAGPVGVGGALTVVGATTLTSTVGIGTDSPSASAILDAQSTTQGVRMPNMTTTQKNAIASPAAGLMVFDTTLSKLCVYSGAAWETITSL